MAKQIGTLFIILLIAVPISAQQSFHRSLKLMGSGFQITVVVKDSTEANRVIDLAIGEI